jgi:hypothetical protein
VLLLLFPSHNFQNVLWGSIAPIMMWGMRYRFRGRVKIAKFFCFYDPAKGSPDYEKGGKRYYSSRAGLPDLQSLLDLPGLESVEVLSITSYLFVLTYRDEIIRALKRRVKFKFLLLDPEDKEHVQAQTQNYNGRNIKQQIESTIKDLESLRMFGDLTIHLYRKMISDGVLILTFNDSNYSWIKTENYPSGKGANPRQNIAWYRKENNKDFEDYSRALEKMLASK